MIEITRSSSYSGGRAFFESTENTHKHGKVCNCTTYVTEKPESQPHQVGLRLKYKSGNLEIEHSFPTYFQSDVEHASSPHLHITIDWGNRDNHKYFWFTKNALQLEYPAVGYNSANFLLENIYRGQFDTSKFCNNHYQSKILEKETFSPNDIWMYNSMFGKESFEVVDMSEMVGVFDLVNASIEELRNKVLSDNLGDIKSMIEGSKTLMLNFSALDEWASGIDILNTPIYEAAIKIRDRIRS